MDLGTASPRRLTSLRGRELFPKIAPDGRSVAFTSEVTGQPQVWVVAVDGGTPRQVTTRPSMGAFYPDKSAFDRRVRIPKAFNLQGAWRGYRGGMVQDLWRFDLSSYAWPPDAAHLVAARWVDSDRTELVAIEVASGAATSLGPALFSETAPAFSPDGRSLYSICQPATPVLIGRIDLGTALVDLDRICRREWSWEGGRLEVSPAELLPVPRGRLSELVAGDGEMLYRRRSQRDDEAPSAVERFQLGGEAPEPLGREGGIGLTSFTLVDGGASVFVGRGREVALVATAEGSTVDLSTTEWRRVPGRREIPAHEEWSQIVRETWRWQRALHFGGLEEGRAAERQAATLALVPRLESRADLNDLLGQSIAALGVGHLYAAGGDLEWVEADGEWHDPQPLRREWVEGNRRRVAAASAGRVGYVQISNFSDSGLAEFFRQWIPQLDREAVLVDARGADGGYLAEVVLGRMARRPVGWNLCSTCGTWSYPAAACRPHAAALSAGVR